MEAPFKEGRKVMFWKDRKEFRKKISAAFPGFCQKDVLAVLRRLLPGGLAGIGEGMTWQLSDGETVSLPHRIWSSDALLPGLPLTERQRLIYHCIFTRSSDGYARQRHAEALLERETPEWVMPFILDLSQDYVAEILEVLYNGLRERDNGEYQAFCRLNWDAFHKGYDRMLSYWAEYYRWYDPRTQKYCKTRYRDYVGWKLYAEVFGCKK